MGQVTERYTSVAISLHWLIALSIVLQLASGLWMGDAIRDDATKAFAFEVFQWHKSLGLTVLLLSLLRLAWRLGHRAPPLPEGMSLPERLAARTTHVLFYVLMIALPMTGWLVVSTSTFGLPTLFWGLFAWPHLPVEGLEAAAKAAWHESSEELHELLAYVTIALLVLHVAAVLKHQWVDRDGVLGRMLPFARRPLQAGHRHRG